MSETQPTEEDREEQRARIQKLVAETALLELQRKLYPIVIAGGALIGIAAFFRLFV